MNALSEQQRRRRDYLLRGERIDDAIAEGLVHPMFARMGNITATRRRERMLDFWGGIPVAHRAPLVARMMRSESIA